MRPLRSVGKGRCIAGAFAEVADVEARIPSERVGRSKDERILLPSERTESGEQRAAESVRALRHGAQPDADAETDDWMRAVLRLEPELTDGRRDSCVGLQRPATCRERV